MMPEYDEVGYRPAPPNNLDAEKAVLAAMILDREVVEDVLASIEAQAFYRSAHQKIFNAMVEMNQSSTPIDMVTLADKLEALGQLNEVGGQKYLLELADNTYALSNWRPHMQIVKNDALLRELIDAALHIQSLGYSNTDDADNAVEESERLLFNVTHKRISNSFQDISSLVDQAQELLEELERSGDQVVGVHTGFRDLDHLLAGMRGGDLLILAARPSIGKTSLALNIAVNAAKLGTTVAFFSLEMPAQQLTQRILASESGVDSHKMRTGRLGVPEWREIHSASNMLKKTNFVIDDSPGLNIFELRNKARRQLRKVEPGKGLIVIDYLQLMSSTSGREKDRHLEVGEISRGLKILAKELGMPVLALSQLNRDVETRADKRPQLSDLRESGSIEQDADVVMFVDRSLSEEEATNSKRPDLGIAKLIVGKNRNGPIGDIEMVFIKETTTFRDQYR